MGHIKREHLSQAKCLVPSDAILLEGSKNIGNLFKKQIDQRLEIHLLSELREELRDTLLPKLLSSEITLTAQKKKPYMVSVKPPWRPLISQNRRRLDVIYYHS